MLNLQLDKFTDTGSGGGKKPHDKIPFRSPILLHLVFQEDVVGIADDIFQEGLLLSLYRFQAKVRLVHIVKILVDGLNPLVDSLRLEVLDKVGFVQEQVLLVHLLVSTVEFIYSMLVCRNRVVRHIVLAEAHFKFFHSVYYC